MRDAFIAFASNAGGGVIVLSTMNSKLFSSHHCPIARASDTCVTGLAIVSENTARVFGCFAAITSCIEVTSTKVSSTPKSCNVSIKLRVLPNKYWLTIMWSPALNSDKNVLVIAAIPVAKQTLVSPPSKSATIFCSATTEPDEEREYTCPTFLP